MKPPRERHDSTAHRDCAENRDPVLSHDPVEINDREEPIEPTDRALPIEPTDSTEPTDPTESTDPTDPIDSTESRDHSDSSDEEDEHEEDGEAEGAEGSDGFVMRPCCPLTPRNRALRARRVLDWNLSLVPTIAELSKQAETARRDGADAVDVDHAQDGRPTGISIDWDEDAIDEEAYTLSGYEALG